MFNLIKYEFKSNFKEFMSILLTIIIANIFLLSRRSTKSYGVVVSLSTVIYIISMVIILISSIKFMSKYIYEDSGYLLFTLPQSGYAILGSRLILALLETFTISVIGYLFVQINLNYNELVKSLFKESISTKTIILAIVSFCIRYIFLLTAIYFSIILGKVILGDRKIGKFSSLIIFIIISLSHEFIASHISERFPKEIYIDMFSNSSGNSLNTFQNILSINIATAILEIIVFFILFFGSVYLMENKLDL